jgi:hypothetical protein
VRLVVLESPYMPQQRAVESLIAMPSSEASQIYGRACVRDAGLTDWEVFRDSSKNTEEIRKFAHRLIRQRNTYYARAAMLDCLQRGEAPFASHLLYGQVLDDDVPEERSHGMEAGLALSQSLLSAPFLPQATHVFYVELGVSEGMLRAAWKLGRVHGDLAFHAKEIEGHVLAAGRKLGDKARAWYLGRVPSALAWLGEGAAS